MIIPVVGWSEWSGPVNEFARQSKATVIASGITLMSIAPLAAFHIAAPLFAPMVGGYWAGHNVELSERESVVLGLITALMAGLPLPLIYSLGYFHYLAPLAIGVFAITFALYAGGLVGIFAWWGGSVARADEIFFSPE